MKNSYKVLEGTVGICINIDTMEIISRAYATAMKYDNVIVIDELIAPTIVELNKKGYETKFCCSGHIHDNCKDGYITFKKNYKFNELPKFMIYGKWQQDIDSNTYRWDYVNEFMDNDDYEERIKWLTNINLELYKWAKSLPNIKEEF